MGLQAFGLDLILLTLVGGWMGLDRRGAFQFMICQPIVALPMLGLMFGNVGMGLQLGVLLQLLWMTSSLFGANVPANETSASLAIGGMVFLFMRHGGQGLDGIPLMMTAILLGAPLCLAGRWLEMRTDRANLKLARVADLAARDLRPARLDLVPLWGLMRAFATNGALVVSASVVGWLVLLIIEPMAENEALEVALVATWVFVVPGVGLGVALSQVRRRRGMVLAALTFILVLVATQPGVGG